MRNRRVSGCLFKKTDDSVIVLIRKMYQVIPLGNGAEIVICLLQRWIYERRQRRIFELREPEIRKTKKVKIVVVAAFTQCIVVVELKYVGEEGQKRRRHITVVYKTAGRPYMPLYQAFANFLNEVTAEFVVDVQLCIPG